MYFLLIKPHTVTGVVYKIRCNTKLCYFVNHKKYLSKMCCIKKLIIFFIFSTTPTAVSQQGPLMTSEGSMGGGVDSVSLSRRV